MNVSPAPCTQCGAVPSPTDKFCNTCGAPVNRGAAPPPPAAQAPYAYAPPPSPYGAAPPAGAPPRAAPARCQMGHEIAPGASYCPQGHPIALDAMKFANDQYGGPPPPQAIGYAPPPQAPPPGYAPPGYPQGPSQPSQPGFAPPPPPYPAPGLAGPPQGPPPGAAPSPYFQPAPVAPPAYAPAAQMPPQAPQGYGPPQGYAPPPQAFGASTTPDVAPNATPVAKMLRGFLVSYQSNTAGDFWPLTSGRLTVGRANAGEPTDIPLADATISSRHAALSVDAATGVVILEDTSSTNGTYVNEEHIGVNGRRELRDGDRVRFGGFTTIVKIIGRI